MSYDSEQEDEPPLVKEIVIEENLVNLAFQGVREELIQDLPAPKRRKVSYKLSYYCMFCLFYKLSCVQMTDTPVSHVLSVILDFYVGFW